MAFSAMTYFVFGEQVTAARINNFIDNDNALRNGTGLNLNAGTIGSAAIASEAWSSGTPSPTGFSALTTQLFKYIKLGRTVIGHVHIDGTSNATTLTFTLPYAAAASRLQGGFCAANASAATANPARIDTAASSTTATCYRDQSGAAWTNSGSKYIIGTLVYEATS